MKWDEQQTLKAADEASSLSDLLEQDDSLKLDALKWLKPHQIEKFVQALDAKESERIAGFLSRDWSLLDWLWVIGPSSDWKRQYLNTSDEPGAGRELITRFAEFQSQRVSRWWRWRWKNGHGLQLKLTRLQSIVIAAISQTDFKRTFPAMTEITLAAILRRKPDFIELLPVERFLSLIKLDIDKDTVLPKLVQSLTEQGIPSDSNLVVNSILDLPKDSDAISELDELLGQWKRLQGPDPVALSVAKSERLRAVFSSLWHSPSDVSETKDGSNIWKHPLQWSVRRALASAANAAPDQFKLELGFSVGVRIAEKETDPSRDVVRQELESVGIESNDSIVTSIFPMVELWTAIRTLAKYEEKRWQHETELLGLRTRIASLAMAAPELWSQSLTWVLVRASKLGDLADAVTLELAASTSEVRTALENACDHETEDVRLKARGLRTLLHGLEDPQSGLTRTLADAAAHYIDGSPIFPHPLTTLSATWLGSIGVERAIVDGIRRATNRFAQEVRDQGGDIEEALTKALVKEIEVEFRAVRPRLKLLGSGRAPSPPPVLTVRQRPIAKVSEEPIYGCDLAWLLNGNVRGRYSSTWVELVQIKKTTVLHGRRKAGGRADSWRIESKQLKDILKWSATATYWLIASDGELLVIPAKHLIAIQRGREKSASAEKFTVGYHEIRSAAIPLEQYLVELVIGQWVGTISPEVLSFAVGESTNIRPRMVIEVTITVNQENQ